MKEKKPISPNIVFATILFLLMFIALPPYFRFMFPKEEVVVDTSKKYTLVCSKVSVNEKMRIVSKIDYEDHAPVINKITYMPYAADDTDVINKESANKVLSAAEELALFRKVEGILIKDVKLTTVVTIEKANIDANQDNLDLLNFFLPTFEEQMTYYQGQGYSCNVN